MNFLWKYCWIILLGLSSLPAKAQITAQGQGGHLVLWTALGAEQQLGRRWVNKNAIAFSRHSTLNDWNPVRQRGVFTVREELAYRLSPHVTLAQGLFYAQRAYDDATHPRYLNEVRLYPRVIHAFRLGRIHMAQYLRCDVRFFSAPGFTAWQKPFSFRNRYQLKGTLPLDGAQQNFLIGITEFFFATDETIRPEGGAHFSPYAFTENRSSLFFRHHLTHPDAFLDVGLMDQTWKDSQTGHFRESWLLQFDLIFRNPFSPSAS
ncbi:Protein of unknown function [Catalinimonas alkaloidigena]|uniref:DUF2490 domain-containing protein n=1 Tax=Catalinimonas alkaloidigena TaxID=1075417 RepID=A0A1G8XDB5_9BACT|nr:DUF2490 domain-containing protein [Catalinimonas alkaloidigena]SDJ88598.1 Protein of unknown function [Catalinimonas alkaloidigena]